MFEEETVYEAQKRMIWSTIRSLPDGEHILGRDLRNKAGIKDRRIFYKIIEDYRKSGVFIGANRQSPKGYYEIRTDNDLVRFIQSKRTELRREEEVLNTMERQWFRKVIPNHTLGDDEA